MRRTPLAALLSDLELLLSSSRLRWFRILKIVGLAVLGFLAPLVAGPSDGVERFEVVHVGRLER